MDSVRIVTQTAWKVAVIEAATMDVVAVAVVLAEVDAATVMTATLGAFPSNHHLIPHRDSSTLTSILTATTSSKPTNLGAHPLANPNGRMSKQVKPSPKPKKKMKVQRADGMLVPRLEMAGIPVSLRSPMTQLPQLTLTVPLRPRDAAPPMLQPKPLRNLSLRTTAALTPTTSPSKRRRN